MKAFVLVLIVGLLLTVVIPCSGVENQPVETGENMPGQIANPVTLPSPVLSGGISVEEAIQNRRSVRRFSDESIKLADVSQLLWAAQGITGSGRFRTAPSAGATYPLEVYLVAGNVENLQNGVFKLDPHTHTLTLIKPGDIREELASAALGQQWVKEAPAILILSGVIQRTAARYGDRARRYMYMESGMVAENVFLQGLSCHLGSVMIGAFRDEEVKDLIGMEDGEEPLAIIPVGR